MLNLASDLSLTSWGSSGSPAAHVAIAATTGTAAAALVTWISSRLGDRSDRLRGVLLSSLTAGAGALSSPSVWASLGAEPTTTTAVAAAAAAAVVSLSPLLLPPNVSSKLLAAAMAVVGVTGIRAHETSASTVASVMLLLLVPQVVWCAFRKPGWLAAAHSFDSSLWSMTQPPLKPAPHDLFVETCGGKVHLRLIQTDGSSSAPQDGPLLPEGTQAVIIFIPDAPVFVEHAIPVAELVARSLRLPVAVFDLPGFGLSRPAPTYDHRLPTAAAVIEDVARHLKAPRVFLYGSCVTGLYCLAYAQRAGSTGGSKGGSRTSEPCPCAGVVVGNTPCLEDLKRWAEHNVTVQTLFVPFAGQFLMRLAANSLVNRWFSYSIPADTPDRPERLRSWSEKSHHCLGKQGGCWCFAGVVQGLYYDGVEAVQKVPSTTLVTSLWGPGDRSHKRIATKPTSLESLVPHAKTVVLPSDAGHAPGFERPDLLVVALREQVEAVLGKAAH